MIVLLTASLLVFSSCGGDSNKFKMSEITADDLGLHWEAVDGAEKYSVVVNDETAVEVTTPSYKFSTITGDYVVKVTAIAANGDKSTTASFSYEAKYTSLASANAENGVITWGEYVGKCIEIKGQSDESFTPVQGSSYTVTRSDLYLVRAASGYNDHVYYIANPSTSQSQKGILVSVPATDTYVLEDGSAEDSTTLQENYNIKKYVQGSGWVDTGASIILDSSNKGISEGHCVKLSYWHYSQWFKFTKQISLDKRYDTFSFKVKGGVATYTSLSFEIVDHLIVGGMDLAGVFISYQINPVEAQWVNYTVSLDDSNWLVDFNGKKQPFDDLKPLLNSAGYTINSLADMMPFFKQFSLRANATSDKDGTNAYMWFDDVTLSNTGASTTVNKPVVLGETYAIESDAFAGNATFDEDNKATLNLTMKQGGAEVSLPVTYEIISGGIRMVSTVENYDFDATFTTTTNGNSFELGSVSGSGSAALANFKASKYMMFDDFESYENTGVGYDSNNSDPTARTELRGNYFCDFFSSNTQYIESPVGGSNWRLMGSTNYLNLKKDGSGIGESQCGEFKYNGGSAMRYINYGMSDGTAEPFSGKYFSFFVKGSVDHDIVLKIRVFKINQIGPTTATSNTDSVLAPDETVEQNSDWHEVRVELNPNISYYGFSITAQTGGSATFFYIDNINVYGEISPWAK